MSRINAHPVPPTPNDPDADPNFVFDRDHFDADDWLNPVPRTAVEFENGAADSLIRAKHIGTARIASMNPCFQNFCTKTFMSRIESEHIDSLTIDDMADGIVWSGDLEYSGGVLANDPSNDYAKIDAMTIGTVGPYSRMWFYGCPNAVFKGDIYGELRLPSLESTETIAVNGGLLKWTHCSEVMNATYPQPTGSTTIPEPRGTSCAERGKIRLRDAQSLHGQIILNAGNGDPTDNWQGQVVVGDGSGSPVQLDPDQDPVTHPNWVAPYYTLASGPLGGGAVGLVPYHLYETDSSPVNDTLIPADAGLPKTTIVTTDFNAGGANAAHPINIRFYGPITKTSGVWNTRVHVRCVPLDTVDAIGHSPMDACDSNLSWPDVTSFVLVRGPGDQGWTDLRGLGISRQSASLIVGAGIFAVDFPFVKCAGTFVSSAPAVITDDACPHDAYYVRVGQDCPTVDAPGHTLAPDDIDDRVEPNLVFACPTGCADFNHSGGITVQDIFDFLAAWFAGSPSADVDSSGNLTVNDVFTFLAIWFQGESCH